MCKVGRLVVSGDQNHLMWFKDWSDVKHLAFLARFQTPGGLPRHRSVTSARSLLCHLDVLFVSISTVSENISMALPLFGLLVSSSLGSVLHHCVANGPQKKKKPVGKGRRKLFGEIHLSTELSEKETSRP